MMIIELMGGLGNQLQQYALYRKYLKLGTKVKLDLCWFDESVQKDMKAKRNIEIDRFSGVSYEVCSDEERKALLGTNNLITRLRKRIRPSLNRVYDESVIYDPELLGFKDRYLRGYFACEYYYADILDELRDELILPEKKELDRIVSDIKEAGSGSCSVHIRRGDYLEEENMKIFGNICTDEYYGSAIETAIRKGAGKFYIFSEDREHALGFADMIRNKYGKEALYVDENRGEDSCYDIYLMSLCNMNICANSTFSFWGARLNRNEGKVMIRPTVQKNSQTFNEEEMKKLWNGWTFIDNAGRIFE